MAFENMSLKELQQAAKDKGLKGFSGLKKQELIELLNNYEKTENLAESAVVNDKEEKRKTHDKVQSNDRADSKENVSSYDGIRQSEATQEKQPVGTVQTCTDPEGVETKGILEVLPDGFGFIRSENFMPGEDDVYVPNSLIKKCNLRTGDVISGFKKRNRPEDKFMALIFVSEVNGKKIPEAMKRKRFENLTPIYPDERIFLENPSGSRACRIVDIISPIGKGQRGMIVAPPKAGKTTLLKEIANAITVNNPDMHVMILLIDERPEEVTDIKESIHGDKVDVIFSTFDEQPEHHKRVSEMVIERAKRLVEQKEDVIILLDSITRLARAYNLTVQPSGRTLSGGLDPAALHMPKRFFGAARNIREGGSLTVLATALVDTGSKMDDVVFEEFKGTGNMELVLDRKLSEKRIFPAIDLAKSGTRKDDLIMTDKEKEADEIIRKALNSLKNEEAAERIIDMFVNTKSNSELIDKIIKSRYI